jgi:hypothetical protein
MLSENTFTRIKYVPSIEVECSELGTAGISCVKELSGFSTLGATVDLFAILASPIFDFDKKTDYKDERQNQYGAYQ